MMYLLGVEDSLVLNLDTNRHEYSLTMEVSQDVLDWLENHDIEYDGHRNKIYLVNNLRYVFLGPKIEVDEIEQQRID